MIQNWQSTRLFTVLKGLLHGFLQVTESLGLVKFNFMAKDSFVYALKQFPQLSLLTEPVLAKMHQKLVHDGRFANHNATLVIRNSGKTDKLHADQMVRNNPVTVINNVLFFQGAMAGQQPGLPGPAAENDSFVYAVQQFEHLTMLTPALLHQFKGCFPGDTYAALLIRKEQNPGGGKEKSDTDDEVKADATIIIDGDDTFDQGSIKGTPPGSTASLDEIMFLKANKSGYIIRQFRQVSDLASCHVDQVDGDFPVYLHYSTRQK
jgi:hypothetical protein